MPSPEKIVLKAYLTPEEHGNIKAAAAQVKLSVSAFTRAVCLGYEPKSKVDQEAILTLFQINSDLSRLGNLLKLLVDQSRIDEKKVHDLLNSIQKTKELLSEKVREL